MSNYDVTVADRLRTMNNTELTTTLVDYVTGVISNVLVGTDYEFTPDKEKYANVIAGQLAEITSEPPRMYTVEELKTMRGDKIYICHINACAGFYQDMYVPYYGNKECYIEDSATGLASVKLPLSFYGSTWVAFTYEPRDKADKNIPIAEKISDYDKSMFKNMPTCQLVNEFRRVGARLGNPAIPKILVDALVEEKAIIQTELNSRRANDPL